MQASAFEAPMADHNVVATFFINFESSKSPALDPHAECARYEAVVEPIISDKPAIAIADTKPSFEELIHRGDDRKLVSAYRRFQIDRNKETLLTVVHKVLTRKLDPISGELTATDGQDEQDRVQEALMAVWKGLDRGLSDPNDFPKQVQECVRRQSLVQYARETRCKKRFEPFTKTDEDGEEYDNEGVYSRPVIFANRVPWQILSDEECLIVDAYLDSTQEQVAERLGVCVRTIGRKYAQIEQKIRNHEPTARRFKSKIKMTG
jgi:DNA-directed RNA polymerase specialized sigma24 family protein